MTTPGVFSTLLIVFVLSVRGEATGQDKGRAQPAPAGQAGPADRGLAILLTASPAGAVSRGVRMGAEEAARTASLLGRRLALKELASAPPDQLRDHARTLASGHANARVLLLDLDEAGLCAIAGALPDEHVERAITLRVAEGPCGRRMLQVRLPADRRAAIESEHRFSAGPEATVEEWHASLERFGAEQLNQRYLRLTGLGMDSESWAGWVAVKIAAELLLRLSTVQSAGLREVSGPTFDGHKGVPLRFDESGVLGQPIYLVNPAATPPVVKELR